MAKRKYHRPSSAASSHSAAMPSQPQQQSNITTVTSLSEFRQEAERLRQSGYYEVPGALGGGTGGSGFHPDYAAYISAKLACDGDCGQQGKTDLPLLHVSSGYAQPVKTANGHEGKYITWGAGNRLPNVVSLLCSLSPYTAAALKFNIDLATGMGPKPMYSYTQYVGGNLSHKTISYDSAGTLLKGWKIDILRQLNDLDRQEREAGGSTASGSVSGRSTTAATSSSHSAAMPSQQPGTVTTNDRVLGGSPAEEPVSDYRQALLDRLAEINADLAAWERTNAELKTFLQNNNLLQTFQQLYADMLLYNICFPEIELQQTYIDPDTNQEVKTYKWNPKAVALRWRNAKTARLGQMNKEGKIDYTYVSNLWLDDPAAVPDASPSGKVDAVRALSSQSAAADLERIARETRQANVDRDRRPTYFACPVVYNQYGHPYYPVPAWYSVFSGDVYTYASLLVSDRKKRRDNANVIGRILYLNDEYVQRMYMQRQITDEQEKMKFFNEQIIAPINRFLQNRDNSGKPMLAYTFTGADGKEYKSWEIVEIQESSKQTAEANQKELAEISSIILFSWSADSRLIGNSPGDVSSSGGTDLRERYLLKQVQMATLQRLVLSVMDIFGTRNQWDTHLTWEIQREVLTTLDNSKTGVTTAEDTSR